MDTACIRIKFTSLIKDINLKNSKCYLEIIPELSYVTNIANLEWKTGYDHIEYEIPINYRIIFKKAVPLYKEEGNKTYYSCVDLLNTTSNSGIELGSGDVSRIVSDNVIIKKLESSMKNNEKCKITRINHLNPVYKTKSKHEGNGQRNEVFIERNECVESFIHLNDNFFIGDRNNLNYSKADKELVSVQIQISKPFTNGNKSEEVSGKEIDIIESKIIKPQSTETLTNCKVKLEPKITLTSIFSIDTNFKPLLQTVYRNDSFNNSQVCSAMTDSVLKENLNVIDKGIIKVSENSTKKTVKDNERELNINPELKILPALRLNHYKQMMENELLPIRIKLNEIISKCIPFGLLQKSHEYEKTMGYGSYTDAYVNVQNNYIEDRSTSNRAVYSVVFNK